MLRKQRVRHRAPLSWSSLRLADSVKSDCDGLLQEDVQGWSTELRCVETFARAIFQRKRESASDFSMSPYVLGDKLQGMIKLLRADSECGRLLADCLDPEGRMLRERLKRVGAFFVG